jgi:hypothetical protein
MDEQIMIRKLVSILFALCLVAALLPSQQLAPQQSEPPHTERMDFATGGTIRIEDSHGDVYVEGWDQPQVEVTILKSMRYRYKPKQPEEATKRLESVRIVSERKSPTELTIATKTTDGVMIEYEIHVPRDSKLVIHHATGSVFVIGVASDVDVTCRRGDIQLMLSDRRAYSIDATTRLGTVMSDFDGNTNLRRYRLGERYTATSGQASPQIRLRMGVGGITIKAVQPEGYSIESGK